MNIILIFPGFIVALIIVFCYEYKIRQFRAESRNRVHFYVARDKNGELWLYIGKPFRAGTRFCPSVRKRIFVITRYNLKSFGLNEYDYANLKWEDEPVEVFVNMED